MVPSRITEKLEQLRARLQYFDHLHRSRHELSIGYPYYDNGAMLPFHYAAWGSYPAELRSRVRFLLVDDGSPTPLEPPPPDLNVNLKIFRIKQDIVWNIPGAKNLLLFQAETPWILVSDIDHIVSPD